MIGWLAAGVTLAATAATIVLEPQSRDRSRTAKMVASTGFLMVAVAAGALDSAFGMVVVAGLALSWLGDLLLSHTAERAFLAGLVAFLLGHVAYVVAFGVRGIDVRAVAFAAAAAVPAAAVILRWLVPHLSGHMKVPVIVYAVAISAMVVAAVGTHGAEADWRIPVGAALFYASDLFVARDRFVLSGRVNRSIGLPLYYGGQLLLAWAAGG